jgi:surface protein
MYGAFQFATVFNQPLNNWNVSSVTGMGALFYDAQAFNQALDTWNVSNVLYMAHMFDGSTLLNFDQNI